jgi:large subunit ribosomal protein L21
MYAVIKTGGKQYRVQAGDMLVVEKLEGAPGAVIKFDQVLMLGDDAGATIGAPLVEGAAVTATLIETRKGEKIKIFKKIRRQGYRRTTGHRQPESVLRVTGLTGGGKTDKWDGKVDLTTLAELNARARGLAPRADAKTGGKKKLTPAHVDVETVVDGDADSAIVHGKIVEHSEAAPTKAAPKKAPAKAEAAPKAANPAEAKPAAKKAAAPKAETADKAPAKKTPSKPKAPKA